MFGNFKDETREVLMLARREKNSLKHPYVGSEHLLLAILKSKNIVSSKLKEYGVTYDKFKEEIISTIGIGTSDNEFLLYTPLLKRVIENAILDSKETNHGVVLITHLFSALLEEGEGIAVRILISLGVNLDEVYMEFRTRFVKDNSVKKDLLLDEIGIDLNKKALEGKVDPVVGRDVEVKRVLEILSRRCKNNPVLIGEAGVGKTAIVEEVARRLAFGEVPSCLKNKRIVSVSMSSFVAGTKYRGEFEERMTKILKEVEESNDVILFVDEIHTLVGAGGAEGAIDASNILKPALARGNLHMIGATTTYEYKKSIDKDAALERRFQKVIVNVPEYDAVLSILNTLKPIYEDYHNVTIPSNLISSIVSLASKYIFDRVEPDRSIDLLDEVCARVHLRESKEIKELNLLKKTYNDLEKKKNNFVLDGNYKKATLVKEEENKVMNDINLIEISLYDKRRKVVQIDDVYDVLKDKGNDIFKSKSEIKKSITNFDNKFKCVVGQNDTLISLKNIYRKMLVKDSYNPSILIMGTSGSGKSLISNLFSSSISSSVIKLDMNEYSEATSLTKLIGSDPGYVGYDDFKNVMERIRTNPYSVLILDEIEKAHPKVIGLFNEILENRVINDSKGNTIHFDHVSIIMTSNISKNINVGFLSDSSIKDSLKDYFPNSFINRISNIICLNSLTDNDILSIIHNKINEIKKNYSDIKISFSKEFLNHLVSLCDVNSSGARIVNKILRDNVEDVILESVLDGKKKIHFSCLKKVLN